MECYGKFYKRRDECPKCKLKRYCATAGDPPLYARRSPPEAVVEKLAESHLQQIAERSRSVSAEKPRYTRSDLLEVIGFMAALDHRALSLIEDKLQEPSLPLSELAAKRKVSRQAMHSLVIRRLSKIPELESIITFYKHRNNIDKTKTFMEVVCQIKSQVRSKQSKQPKPDCKSLKSWSCLNRNTLLSPTSIFKGGGIWKNG